MQVNCSHRTVVAITVSLLCGLLVAGVAEAREVQLAGMRLGQHAVNLLDIYGEPMGIATGQGEAFASGGAGAGIGMEGMGMEMGMEGAMPMGEPGMPPAAAEGPGAFPEGEEGAMPGAEGAEGVGAAATTGGVQQNPYPLWALPVWVDLEANQIQWLYRVGPVVLGFVLDRDGYIESIAVAGEECNFARTSMWQPHQYVKLGDNYKRVIYRYGWPDETLTYYSTGPGAVGVGGGPISVTFGGTVREFSRDAILRYTENNNIEFTFHNLECVRIHIWTHE
ncbi:MAG: hypothetical protein GX131_06260 [candidate division WS1 bacterium]|jgi:hypothetical protein|nr:hypothetical protein [candidate division WS1 bacterium]